MSKTTDLEKENEELRTHITQLESQIDSYRFGKEIESWPPAVDLIKEGLTGDVEKKKKELAGLIAETKETQAHLDSLLLDIAQKKSLAHEANLLRAEVSQLETKAAHLRGDYDFTGVMQLVQKLCQTYEFTNNTFRFKLGHADDLTSSDVETLLRRALIRNPQ
jgi:uncharacterized protein YlxW (UPF0749 family)